LLEGRQGARREGKGKSVEFFYIPAVDGQNWEETSSPSGGQRPLLKEKKRKKGRGLL